METHRTVALATEVLRRRGVAHPRDHMLLIKSPYSIYGAAVSTLLISNQPFSPADVQRIQNVAQLLAFQVVLAPAPAKSDAIFQRIAEAPYDGAAKVNFPGDISAPTDNRPFFFQMLHFRDIFNPDVYGGLNNYVTQPVLVLFSLSVSVLALTVLCILLPLVLTTSREALRGAEPLVLFFCAIGLGFLLLEISQMQRLTVFLGHPTYSLSVVLFSLLVFSGIGSLATEWLAAPKPNPGLRPTLLLPLLVLLPVLVVFGFLTPSAVHHFDDKTTPVRILISVGILAPMGFLMGMPFPLGMKVASRRPSAPTAFFWGINGATSVCASVLAVAIALGWGISMSFWVGCGCYAVAAMALGLVVFRQPA